MREGNSSRQQEEADARVVCGPSRVGNAVVEKWAGDREDPGGGRGCESKKRDKHQEVPGVVRRCEDEEGHEEPAEGRDGRVVGAVLAEGDGNGESSQNGCCKNGVSHASSWHGSREIFQEP